MSNDNYKWYLELSDADKPIFLALVMAQLTIHGRAFSIDLTPAQQGRAFAGLNELQHQISNHCVAIGMNKERYPEDTFLLVVKEKALHYGLSARLSQSFDFAKARDYWNR
jgi:hypothetical protein